MTEEKRGFEKLGDSIDARFELSSVIAETLTAQAFSAVDIRSQERVTLWRTRGPLMPSEVERFGNRLLKMQRVRGVEPILWSGVDSLNRGFAVLPHYDARPLHCPVKGPNDLEKRFAASVAIVEALHERSIVCGDLCLDSFSVNDRGKVSLFAVLGDVGLEYEDEEFNEAKFLAFRPPEQKAGGMQHPSADVYALGWIGEGLFASAEHGDDGKHAPPPTWLKNVLRETASAASRRKTNTAATVRLILESHVTDAPEADGVDFALMEVSEVQDGGTIGDACKTRAKNQCERGEKIGGADSQEESANPDDRGEKSRTLDDGRDSAHPEGATEALRSALNFFRAPSRVLILLILNLGGLGVLLVLSLGSWESTIQYEKAEIAANLQVGVEREQVKKWYASDEPAVHTEVVQKINEATSQARRDELVRTLIFRSRRLGLSRSADVALRFTEQDGSDQADSLKSTNSLVFRVLDPSVSQNQRLEDLAKLYDIDPQIASVLTASLALDVGDAEAFRGILARAVSDQVGIPNGGEHSPFALILLVPQAHDLFSEDIVEINERIPASDISWLLQELGRKGHSGVSTVAQLAYNRGIVTGAFGVFLRELQRGAALSEGLRASLVSGALGRLSEADINRFAEWYGQGAPRVLEAGILTAGNPKIEEAAFQALGTKAISDQYVANVLEFVRSAYEGDGAKYGGIVAILALRDVVDSATIDRELEKIQGAPHLSALLKELVKGAPPELLEAILARYGASMDPLDIVDLLGHPSPAVRIAAVSHLSQVNDIMLLKLISQSYDEEKDPKVRSVYEQQISVIRDRGNPGA